ncbi:hypothetical protein BN85410560 [Alteracholeplasma palmae J233]|uniref:Uncharacterized protein n=1 Tax=Alteracholeplasma palmae (strain ATCC 49389 / J233) TaxID=1318466 RepID=U4KLE5_ALTPJ|nr:hypothetical protein [Alteracholeplasma palmae]CCV64633.1 hypothetical protein BN85410560 [Alteracholeplasma palmae J233]
MGRPYNQKDLYRQNIIAIYIVTPIVIGMFITGAIMFRKSMFGIVSCIIGAVLFFLIYTGLLLIYKFKLKKANQT